MAFKFPFTNYHELNLTWVLDQLKALFEKSEENVTTIETYEGRLSAVEGELPVVAETASEASRAAASAGTLAQTAKATADTAQNNAIQAQGLAGTARQEAQAAQTAANEATQAAQQAQATAQNFDGRITQAENDASHALEASRSFENRVQSAITTANNASQTATNAQGIAMRADQNAGAALDKIGDLSELTTEAKQNLVAAINEAAQSGGGGGAVCAPLIINTASGAIASFSDGADGMPIKKLVAQINPVQDLHGYENPWPGGGGANKWDEQWVNGGLNGKTGDVYNSDTRIASKNFIPVVGGETYYIKGPGPFSHAWYDANKVYISGDDGSSPNYPRTAPANAAFLKFAFSGATYNHDIAVNYPATVTTYSPYSNICPISGWTGANIYNEETYNASATPKLTINWESEAGTIYGGTVTLNQDGSADVVSTMGDIVSYAGETLSGAWISSMDVYAEGATPTTGAQVVYELAAHVTHHFDNIGQLKTFLGTNNVWIDTGAITECDYPADTKLYIDNKIAELQALILEN